jgi:hypothetical protein
MLNKFLFFFALLFTVNSTASEIHNISEITNLDELNKFITNYSKVFQEREDSYGIVNKLYIKDNIINYDYILDNGVFVNLKTVKKIIFNIGTDFRDGYCQDSQFNSIQKLNVPIRVNYFHEDENKAIYNLSIEKEDCIDI